MEEDDAGRVAISRARGDAGAELARSGEETLSMSVEPYAFFGIYRSGVGIVSVGDRDPFDPELSGDQTAALELKAAFVNGIRYPASSTPVDPATWGKVKHNQKH